MYKILCDTCESTFLSESINCIRCSVCEIPIEIKPSLFANHYIGLPVNFYKKEPTFKGTLTLDKSIDEIEDSLKIRALLKSKPGYVKKKKSKKFQQRIKKLRKSLSPQAICGVLFFMAGLLLILFNFSWILKKNPINYANAEEEKIFSSINDYLKLDLPKIDINKIEMDHENLINYSKAEKLKEARFKNSSSTNMINEGEDIILPVPIKGKPSSSYGYRVHPVKGIAHFHTGTDLPRPHGSPIRAALSGKVIFSGWKSGYGNVVILKHDEGYTTLYGHNSKNLVKVDQMVKQNQIIALVGSTGVTTGTHLHFELRKNGKYLNPLKYLQYKKLF